MNAPIVKRPSLQAGKVKRIYHASMGSPIIGRPERSAGSFRLAIFPPVTAVVLVWI